MGTHLMEDDRIPPALDLTNATVVDVAESGVRWPLQETAFAADLAAWPLPAMALDCDLRFTHANASYLAMLERDWERLEGKHVFEAFPAPDGEQDSVRPVFLRTLGGAITHLEDQNYPIERAGGSVETRVFRATQVPIVDTASGFSQGSERNRVVGLVQYVSDVTEQVASRHERDLMARELSHRTKNVFSMVSAITRMTAREAEDVDALVAELQQRFGALGRAHARLYENAFKGAPLGQLLQDEFGFLATAASVTLQGPDVFVPEHLTAGLSLVIHELATNAAKHGCFAGEGGCLAVTWETEGDTLYMVWTESGRGAADIGKGTGFGSTLLRMVPGLEIDRVATDDGLKVRLKCAGIVEPGEDD